MRLPTSTARFILFFMRKQWGKFAFLVLAFIIWSVGDALLPYFLKRIIDGISHFHGERSRIYAAETSTLMLIVLFGIATEYFMRGQGIVQIYAFPKLRAEIRETVFKYVLSHSYQYFSSEFAGNIAKKIADLATSCQSIIEIICCQYVTAITGTMIVLTMMWLVNTLFASLLMIWLVLHFGIIFIFMRRNNQLSAIHADAISMLSGKAVDTFTNILNVRLFARERYESRYLDQFQNDEIKKAHKAMWSVEMMRFCLGLNGLFLMFSMLFGLLYCWTRDLVTIGDFTQIFMQAWWLLGWMWYISFQMTVFTRETGTIENALSLIRKTHDVNDKPQAPDLTVQAGQIEFKNVLFAYHKSQPVFHDFSLHIPAGQKVGLVGFSGSGKSTFVNLILRFYDVEQGAILIDQQNIADVKQHSLRDNIAMIPQDPTLFHRSLMENIRYGRLEATDTEVIEASKLAHCHAFIEKLDDGYESLVGERGVKLSGGQRQRIAIARAILKNAPILILDEATSSLDTVTEKLIQESLHTLMRNKTTLIIAHRLSTLADMDTILVFSKGKVIEAGTKTSLLKQQGHFAMLWNMQTDGFLPEC